MTDSLSELQEVALLPGLGAGLAFLIVLVLVFVVVVPAVWSRNAERRSAALMVLRLLLRHWARHRSSKGGRRGRVERRTADR